MNTSISISSLQAHGISEPNDLRPYTLPDDPGFVIFHLDRVEAAVDQEDLDTVGLRLVLLGNQLRDMAEKIPEPHQDEPAPAEQPL